VTLQVVVDTNLIVSAFLWGGLPEKLISELLARRIPMLTTQAMIDELGATLRKPKFASRFQAKGVTPDELMDGYRQMTQLVTPAEIPDGSVRDPKDRIILAAAVGGSASHLVQVHISGDKDLTSLQQYNEVIILTVAQFLAI
jgi:putative PIN family toxin of toxin-antitoxin system